MNEKGIDFYSRLVDELLAAGIQPCVDPVPLGPAPGPPGSGRLGQPGDGLPLRRLRNPPLRASRGPRPPLDHPQRGAHHRGSGSPGRAAGAGDPRPRHHRARHPPPAALPRPGGAGLPRRGQGGRDRNHPRQYQLRARRRRARDRRGHGARTRFPHPPLPRSRLRARLSRDRTSATTRNKGRPSRCRTEIWS